MEIKNRLYTDQGWWKAPDIISEGEKDIKECEQAIEIAHDFEITKIVDSLLQQRSTLIVTEKLQINYLINCLKKRIGKKMEFRPVDIRGRSAVPPEIPQRLTSDLRDEFAKTLEESKPSVVIVKHLNLMMYSINNTPLAVSNDVIYWLSEYYDRTVLAFWDQLCPLPSIIEHLFPNKVYIQIIKREILWKLISSREAKKLCTERNAFSLASQLNLYQYLSGTTAGRIRQIMRKISDERYPEFPDKDCLSKIYKEIHKLAGAHETHVLEMGNNLTGYDTIREDLYRRIVFPTRLRYDAKNEKELYQADVLIPRGVLLYGPAGTGKTEWAKWLSQELGASLFIIHGPELKSKYVGETEASVRNIFSKARQCAPSVILIDEIDSLMPSRDSDNSSSTNNYDASMVAQFLTEMDGLHKDEAVLVLGTTNRFDAVDSAFKRPGRFGVQIYIDYPDEQSRKAIISFYNKKFCLNLKDGTISEIVNKTKNCFSGDDLRGICLYLLRENLYNLKNRREFDVNSIENINALFPEVNTVPNIPNEVVIGNNKWRYNQI